MVGENRRSQKTKFKANLHSERWVLKISMTSSNIARAMVF